MKVRAATCACLAIAVASPSTAHAATYVLTGTLSGANEAPQVATPGTGSTTVTFNDATNILSVQIIFSGLTSPTAAAHIHCCAPPGGNAGVATPVPTFPGFPLGVISGTYSSTFDLTSASSFNPAFVTANGGSVATARTAFVTGLLAGQSYLNIHSGQFPNGEIRTQLTLLPEPASWAMMAAGFALVGGAVRAGRRRPRPATG